MADSVIAGRLPTFLLIGATKCGTDSLHTWLCAHPNVFMHPTKELRYFSVEHKFRRGADWYRAQFTAAGDRGAVGESSNSYTRDPVYGGIVKRIHELLPTVRLIYSVRDPIHRIESHYRHRIVTGVEWRDADRAIADDPTYVAASRYGHQLARYLQYFSRDQILLLRLEQTIVDPDATMRRVSAFLGVEHPDMLRFPHRNQTSRRPAAPALVRAFSRFTTARPAVRAIADRVARSRFRSRLDKADKPAFDLSPATRERLAKTFIDDVRLLSDLTGERFDDWDLATLAESKTDDGSAV